MSRVSMADALGIEVRSITDVMQQEARADRKLLYAILNDHGHRIRDVETMFRLGPGHGSPPDPGSGPD